MLTALLELRFRDDGLEMSMGTLHDVIEGTRAFPGCEGVDVLVDVTDPSHIILVQRWATPEDDAAYRVWRSTEGKTSLGDLLRAPAVLTKLHLQPGI
jgi:quinol monooxygenase YgiN